LERKSGRQGETPQGTGGNLKKGDISKEQGFKRKTREEVKKKKKRYQKKQSQLKKNQSKIGKLGDYDLAQFVRPRKKKSI